jgi:phage tail protein X
MVVCFNAYQGLGLLPGAQVHLQAAGHPGRWVVGWFVSALYALVLWWCSAGHALAVANPGLADENRPFGVCAAALCVVAVFLDANQGLGPQPGPEHLPAAGHPGR